MPRPKRLLHATELATISPPGTLLETEHIAKVLTARGKNLYLVALPTASPELDVKKQGPTETAPGTLLVELQPQFRSTIWMKRGTFVVVNTAASDARDNKLDGDIINIVRDEKAWRKMVYWPPEFAKVEKSWDQNSDEEESNVGKLPPSDSEEDN
ncbi:hypothetical protein MMC25_004960 [Agyrium rufum]|nr:hypothetical protein [Agyrium rufum]